jgi:hypothetical protein
MTIREYKEKTGARKLPRLAQRTVDLIASGYEWTCPNDGTLNAEIDAPETVICTKCHRRFRASTPEHAHE